MDWALITAFSIPSAITGLSFWLIQRTITKNDERRANREECLMQYQLLLIESSSASISLGKATAIAVRDGKVNGEMKDAFNQVADIERKQKVYLNKQAMEHIF